jgi:predicted nucleotidyltransferase
MKPSEALASNRAAIRQVVESHRACNARVFGSVLRGQDTDSSDLDIQGLARPLPQRGAGGGGSGMTKTFLETR